MNKTLLLVTSALAASIVTSFALGCSSAAEPEATDDKPLESGELGNGSGNTSASTPTTPPSDTGAATTPADAGAADPDASATPASDAGAVDTGASVCVPGAAQESEANDTAGTANAIPGVAGSFCGTLTSAADVDFASFVLPANATYLGFGARYNRGGASFTVSVAGTTFSIGQTPPFLPGQTYVIKVAPTGGQSLAYRVDIDIKQ